MSDAKKEDGDAKVPPKIQAAAVAAAGAAWSSRWKILAGLGGLFVSAAGAGYLAAGSVAEAAVSKAALGEYVSMLARDPQFQIAVAGVSGSPVGCVVAWPSAVPRPDGWAVCDGSVIEAKADDRISIVLGQTYGPAPNGKVKLPDFRGLFLRGFGTAKLPDGRSVEAMAVGELQCDHLEMHEHFIHAARPEEAFRTSEPVKFAESNEERQLIVATRMLKSVGAARAASDGSGSLVLATARQGSEHVGSASEETRPANYAVHWIIRVR